MTNFSKDFTEMVWDRKYESAEELIEAECKTCTDLGELFTQMLMTNHDAGEVAEAKALIAKMVGQYMEFVENFEE